MKKKQENIPPIITNPIMMVPKETNLNKSLRHRIERAVINEFPRIQREHEHLSELGKDRNKLIEAQENTNS